MDVTAQVIFSVGYAPVLKIMAASRSIDAILVSGSLAHPTYIERDLDALVALRKEIDKPHYLLCLYACSSSCGFFIGTGRFSLFNKHVQ